LIINHQKLTYPTCIWRPTCDDPIRISPRPYLTILHEHPSLLLGAIRLDLSHQKTARRGLLRIVVCIILRLVCDRRTDSRTEGRTHSNAALA